MLISIYNMTIYNIKSHMKAAVPMANIMARYVGIFISHDILVNKK